MQGSTSGKAALAADAATSAAGPDKTLDFLSGGGELGALIRAFDWSATALGPVRAWPQSLRTAVSILLNSRYPMFIFWGSHLIKIYNDGYRPILGDKHPWALGRAGPEVWPEIWSDIGPMVERVVTAGEATWSEDLRLFMHRRGFAEEVFFTFSYSPIRDESGGVGGLFCACTETTAKVLGERRLKLLRHLAAATAEARSVADACALSTQILRSNPEDIPFAEIDLGNRRGWPLGVQHVDAVSPLLGKIPAGPWPEPPHSASILPLPDSGPSEHTGVLIVGLSSRLPFDAPYSDFLDLAARHVAASIVNAKAHEEEKKRAELLAELDRAKTAFFSNVSHEFRTPLTLILGPVDEMLEKGEHELPFESRALLSVVQRNGQRLLKLVNTLLDFARIEAGRTQAAFEPTDLARATAELVSNFRSACERAGIRLTVDCPALPAPAYVDREMWEQIVLNLVSNAFKYTFKGEITVALRHAGELFELTVRDTGTGIPQDELARVFDRFHRVEGSRGRSHEGSGIGLALVQELVKAHGGSIAVESELGRGSVFTVSIPVGSSHLPAERLKSAPGNETTPTRTRAYVAEALSWLPPAHPAGLPALPQSAPRIVLADDNADLRDYAHRLLADEYEVVAVADGEAALAAARAQPPDLIISDVMMPRLDGFELIRALRADPQLGSIPVMLLSARAGEEARIEGVGSGADDYLVKPFSARELLVRAGAMLRSARTRREALQQEQRSAEQFRQKLEELETVLRAVPVGVFIADDPQCTRIATNPAGAAMLRLPHGMNASKTGPTAGQLPFRVLKDGVEVPGDDLPMQRAARLGHPVTAEELEIAFADGTSAYFYEYAAPLFDAAGKVRGCVGIFLDFSERKRAEQVLRDSEARFRVFADTAPAMLWVTDADGSCSFLSRQWFAFAGQNEASGLGFGWLEAVHPEDRASTRSTFLAANANRAPFALEHRVRRADGAYRWVLDAGHPRLDARGEFAGYIGSVIDIHDRKLTEERLDLVVNSSGLGLWYCDLPFGRLDWNDTIKEHFGLPVDCEVTIETFFERLHRDDRARTREAMEKAIRERAGYDVEYRTVALDGRERWIRAIGRVTYEGETPVRFDGITIDVTERIRQQEALREADRRKDDFLAVLAHELRNPLAPIRQAARVATLPNATPAQVAWSHGVIERQVQHMALLLDDLLDVSRITRGKLELRKQLIELKSAIEVAVETARPSIEARKHALTLDLPQEPLWLDADPLRLAQVFANLLTNAAKYTPSGGSIRVSARRAGAEIAVVVRDTGIGIEAESLPRIFDMFSQVKSVLDRAEGGLGIGLALVRGLVALHGGQVDATSEGLGRGSTFSVRLPGASEPRVERTGGGAVAETRARRPCRILVADDNRDAAQSLATYLELEGHVVKTAFNGAEALEVARSFRPEVALLDIGMPRLNGYELAERMRAESWGTHSILVAITGWGQSEDKLRAAAAGFSHHLTKPVNVEALRELLARAQTQPGS